MSSTLAKATSILKIDKPTIPELVSIKNQSKIIMSIIEYNNKIYKTTLYKKVLNNLVYGQMW